jgi:protein-S-isoprenylcysteine O-methyltransferase Ste14
VIDKATTTSVPDHSDVVVFPPVIPITGFLAGVALEWLIPLRAALSPTLRIGARGLGALVLLAGIIGFASMVITMKRARTPIHNARTPTTLVESGPFRFTRNPMYVFGSIAYAGLALLLLEPWSLALLPLVIVTMHYGVVRKEEEYLERRFGDDYRRYTARVPRYW